MNNNFFSQRVKELRTAKNLSQKSLGEAIGISMQTINDIENGRSHTTLERAITLADFFEVTLDYLVGRSNDNKIDEGDSISPSKEDELLKNYRLLDDISKGKLIERSRILLEDSAPQNTVSHKMNA